MRNIKKAFFRKQAVLGLVIGILAGAHYLTVFAQREQAPIPIADALLAKSFPLQIPIDLSPDGKLVAYTLRNGRKQTEADRSLERTSSGIISRQVFNCDIWISEVETGRTTNLTGGKGSNWGPVWSPDGRRLGFYSNGSNGKSVVSIWERASGRLEQISNANVQVDSPSSVIRWTSDSRKIVVTAPSEGPRVVNTPEIPTNKSMSDDTGQSKYDGPTVEVFRSSKEVAGEDPEQELKRRNSFLESSVVDLALIDIASGKLKPLLKKSNVRSWWISPDSQNVAVLVSKGYESVRSLQALYDLVVVSLTDGSANVVAHNFKGNNLMRATWSPDSRWIAYISDGPQIKTECFLARREGGEVKRLTDGDHPRFDSSILRGPIWDNEGRNLYLLSHDAVWKVSISDTTLSRVGSIEGRTIEDVLVAKLDSDIKDQWLLVLTRDEKSKREGFYRIDLASGGGSLISEKNESYGGITAFYTTDISSDGRRLVFVSERVDRPQDIWSTDNYGREVARITHINPIFDRYVMGELQMIEWKTIRGRIARGALMLPAGYRPGQSYPLIVYQYPGSNWSDFANNFGFNQIGSPAENWQILASRGYAILVPDVPASPGTYMQDIAEAVLPGVDKVIQMGIADPKRLGVTGQSNGGYGVLSLLVQTDRFSAAVDRMGMGNLISQYTQMSENGTSANMPEMLLRIGGSLWEKREEFIRNSPIFYLDKVKTPLLIIQGTADVQVTPPRSDEIFVSLRFLGKEVEYAKYLGESHGVSNWTYENQLDYLERMIRWFDTYLKAPPSMNDKSP